MTKKKTVAKRLLNPTSATPAININNSLGCVADGIGGAFGGQFGTQLSQSTTLFINNRFYLVSNNRQLLSELYVEHGLVQTLIDQPVDDAFRSGFDIKTSQLSADEIETLHIYAEEHNVIATLKQTLKWARLFGGAGMVILTPQDMSTPFTIDSLRQETPIDFRDADLWELYSNKMNIQSEANYGATDTENTEYSYYGRKIHSSRILRVNGKKAPSFVRPRLRGWGMSEVERLVRSINQYFKNQNVIFELLDEAKVDVYKMKGFNSSLLNAEGSANITKRIQHANMIKNYVNAITMDIGDEYEQKQISFSGLSEVLVQIRQGIASDLKMPMTKLFGISAAGFSSGEDDIENYNSMIEGEIRSKCKQHVVKLMQICCMKAFGFVPDDLMINFKPLRILSAEQEEKVKDSQFNRTVAAYSAGLMEDIEAKEAINAGSLLPQEVDVNTPAREPIGTGSTVGDDYTVPKIGSAK